MGQYHIVGRSGAGSLIAEFLLRGQMLVMPYLPKSDEVKSRTFMLPTRWGIPILIILTEGRFLRRWRSSTILLVGSGLAPQAAHRR